MVTVTVVDAPLASMDADVTSGIPGLEVNFTNSSQDANTYHFSFGSGQTYQTTTISDEPGTTYDHPGVYTVVLTAGNGICEDTAHLTIVVAYAPMSIIVPNIFTPNGDGNNDTFYLRLENGASLEVTIVNRWGNKMASYSGVAGYWDGTVNGNLAEEGVYFFNYSATGMDGTVQTGQGDIQLIRR
jgi:gliding motility-associated-like protein